MPLMCHRVTGKTNLKAHATATPTNTDPPPWCVYPPMSSHHSHAHTHWPASLMCLFTNELTPQPRPQTLTRLHDVFIHHRAPRWGVGDVIVGHEIDLRKPSECDRCWQTGVRSLLNVDALLVGDPTFALWPVSIWGRYLSLWFSTTLSTLCCCEFQVRYLYVLLYLFLCILDLVFCHHSAWGPFVTSSAVHGL